MTSGGHYLGLWFRRPADWLPEITMYRAMQGCRWVIEKFMPAWQQRWFEWCRPQQFLIHNHPHMGTMSMHRLPRKNAPPRWLRRFWPVCDWSEGALFWDIVRRHRWFCPGRAWALYGGIRGSLLEITWKACDWRYAELPAKTAFIIDDRKLQAAMNLRVFGKGRPEKDTIYTNRFRGQGDASQGQEKQ